MRITLLNKPAALKLLKQAYFIGCMAGLIALGSIGSVSAQVNVREIEYHNWTGCYEITNPVVRLVVAPQIGGRVMEYSIAGEDVFWQHSGELGKLTGDDVGRTWRNYGGYKAWNAPQSKWSTTDQDYFYDSMPADIEVLADGRGVRITTAPIKHRGFQFIRDVILSESTSRVRLIERLRNVSDKEIEWSIWDVTQVKVPCWMVFPVNPKSAFEPGWSVKHPPGGHIKQVQVINDIGIMRYDNQVENWETDARSGWMAYIKDRLAYVKRWSTRIVDATYPDGGCDAAFYTCRTDYAGGYAEMEVMGPIVKLQPGEETELVEDWFLTRLDESAKDIPDVLIKMETLQERGLLPRGVKFR